MMNDISLLGESVERNALAELHAAATDETRRLLGLQLEKVGTALVSIASRDPGILLNRTIGLGVEAPDTLETVKDIVSRYAASGVGSYFLHLHPEAQPPELRDWIVQEGLTRYRGWVKFHRDATPPPDLKSELRVRQIGTEHAMDFGRIVAEGFELSEAAAPLLAALADRPGWRLYMSFADDEPAGTGAMFVRDGVGWLDWAATLPAYRGRGGQGVVLCQRIRDALDLGCQTLLTTTGEEVEGDPQHSYKNIERVGFRSAYVRENFVPAGRSEAKE